MGHFGDLSWVCLPLLSPCGFKQEKIPCFSPSIPGHCHDKKPRIEQQIPDPELSLSPLLGHLDHLSCCCDAERGENRMEWGWNRCPFLSAWEGRAPVGTWKDTANEDTPVELIILFVFNFF